MTTALSGSTGAFLEGPADRTAGDGEVAVVAGFQESVMGKKTGKTGDIRQASSFPEGHFDGSIEYAEGIEVKSRGFNRSSEAVDGEALERFGASGRGSRASRDTWSRRDGWSLLG